MFLCLSDAIIDSLAVSVFIDEIRVTLFHMKPWKGLSPDGFHAGFFKNIGIL